MIIHSRNRNENGNCKYNVCDHICKGNDLYLIFKNPQTQFKGLSFANRTALSKTLNSVDVGNNNLLCFTLNCPNKNLMNDRQTYSLEWIMNASYSF
jgi:hypothetical protein